MNKEDKELLREDKPWFDAFMERNYPEYAQRKKANRKKILWASLCSCAAAVAIVLTLVLCLPKFQSDGENKRYYTLGNEAWAQSDLEVVNTDLQRVALQISVDCVQEIGRCYDTQYNDTLFHRIKTLNEETAESVTLYLYTNADYKENHNFSQSYETANVGAFTVQYTTVCTEDEGIYTITHTAQSEYKGVRIYLEYSQMSLSEQSDLLGFFARTFQVK